MMMQQLEAVTAAVEDTRWLSSNDAAVGVMWLGIGRSDDE
jgi:hypothetical protein